MSFGLTESDWKEVDRLAIQPLQLAGATVYVFGSRARGDHRQNSDLDLLFEMKDKLKLFELGSIKDALEDSSIPVKVDLVDLDDVAESYLKGILKDRVKL